MGDGSLLVQVRTKLNLHVRRRARSPLPGDHSSIHKGRSMDFDDLREYQRGDEVKDIDWKSTARTGSVRLKRYVADRKHHVLVVVDSGRAMTAAAADGTPKADLAVLVAGVLGSVVVDQGDLVGLLVGDDQGRTGAPWRSGARHLEDLLRTVRTRTMAKVGDSDLPGLLHAVRQRHRRRLVVAVVTDEGGWSAATADVVRRLRAQHELIWFTLLDLDPCDERWADHDLLDVVTGHRLVAELRSDPAVCEEYREASAAATAARRDELAGLGVLAEEVAGEDDAIAAVLRVLERSRRRVPA